MEISASTKQLGIAIGLTFLAFVIAVLVASAGAVSTPAGMSHCGVGFDVPCDPRLLN